MGIGSVWIVGFECLIGEFKEVGKGGVFYRVLIDGNLGVFLKLHSRWRETLHALERERDRYFIHTYIHTYIYIYIYKQKNKKRAKTPGPNFLSFILEIFISFYFDQ
jgi:hypothetical protein